jgi:hypothetical protein
MKIEVGLIGRGKWGSNIRSKLIKVTNLKFCIGKKNNLLSEIKKNNIKWVFIATPNNTHYSIVKKCLQKGLNIFCEKPLCLSLYKAKTLFNFAKKKNLKLYVSDLYDFYSDTIKKLNLINNVYRSKLVKEKNPEFLDRLMYHDISILYKLLKNNPINKYTVRLDKKKKLYEVLIKLQKKQIIRFTYNLNSKKKTHIINNYHIKSKRDLLNKMIYNVIYNKVNFKENNLKAIFIIKFLNKIRKKTNYAH